MKLLVKLHNAFSVMAQDVYDVSMYLADIADNFLNLFKRGLVSIQPVVREPRVWYSIAMISALLLLMIM